MSLDELELVVPAPIGPVEPGSATEWAAIKERYGLNFPDDYFLLVHRFGSGSFKVHGRLRIEVWNPFAVSFQKRVKTFCGALREGRLDQEEVLPFSIFPDPGGLFPIGIDDNGSVICYRTGQLGEQWSVVVVEREFSAGPDRFQEVQLPLTRLLASVFARKLEIAVWPKEIFDNVALSFQPAQK